LARRTIGTVFLPRLYLRSSELHLSSLPTWELGRDELDPRPRSSNTTLTRPGAAGRSGDHGRHRVAECSSAVDRITTSSSATVPRARRRTLDRRPRAHSYLGGNPPRRAVVARAVSGAARAQAAIFPIANGETMVWTAQFSKATRKRRPGECCRRSCLDLSKSLATVRHGSSLWLGKPVGVSWRHPDVRRNIHEKGRAT
jgi:hypothetical protein